MILYGGEIIDSSIEKQYIDKLYNDCVNTLNKPRKIDMNKVINACDCLYHKVMAGEYDEIVKPLLVAADISYERFRQIAGMFSREQLEYKCRMELGEAYNELLPLNGSWSEDSKPLCVKRILEPQGILFHIAAGNVDGLPAYSVIEGLLVGNINILKLPASDNGLSVTLLGELVSIEPDLKDYIYVFDVPSTETETLKKFAELADAVVVWGSDEAVEAAKAMTDTKTKVIAWGHKLSFAYVTDKATEQELKILAQHVCETNQVLCSSCQGIYVDTEDYDKVQRWAERFFALLLEANETYGPVDIGMRGKNTIKLYNDRLEKHRDWTIHSANGASLIVKPDSRLELSYMFRNLWVKRLPRERIVDELKKYKGYLQTCGLLCSNEERAEIADKLVRAGLVRITKGHMSRMYPGEAHDGRYPLREYSRIVEID